MTEQSNFLSSKLFAAMIRLHLNSASAHDKRAFNTITKFFPLLPQMYNVH